MNNSIIRNMDNVLLIRTFSLTVRCLIIIDGLKIKKIFLNLFQCYTLLYIPI